MNFLQNNKIRYTIFYDDMDSLEEYMEMDAFKSLIKSMIYAAGEINLELSDFSKTKIVILLRSDVVSLLQYEGNNINKTITDLGVEIKWFNPNIEEGLIDHPLMRMVLHKIKNSFSDKDISLEKLKELYFPDEKAFKYVMERSFGRPRDIILYFQEYQEYYGSDQEFTVKHMQKTEKTYSTKFYEELSNEIRMTGRQEQFKIIFNNISNRGYSGFKFRQLEQYMSKRGEDTSELLSDLSVMVDMGILGTGLKNKKVEFSYRDNLVKSVTEETRFILHYALKKHFSIN